MRVELEAAMALCGVANLHKLPEDVLVRLSYFEDQPHSAIAAGLGDLIAPPDKLPARILTLWSRPSRRRHLDLATAAA